MKNYQTRTTGSFVTQLMYFYTPLVSGFVEKVRLNLPRRRHQLVARSATSAILCNNAGPLGQLHYTPPHLNDERFARMGIAPLPHALGTLYIGPLAPG